MSDEDDPASEKGERFRPELTFKFIDSGPVEAGETLAPARITSAKGRQFAAFHLAISDLSFAHACLVEADKIGIPDDNDPHSKSLIFSAVVSYARSFKSGVRETRLRTEMFSTTPEFDNTCHEYLVAMRDKHIAHSVNEFEQCEAIAIVIGKPDSGWRNGGAIGTVRRQAIGMNRDMVRGAIAHLAGVIKLVSEMIEQIRGELYQEFSAKFAADGQWEMAPIFTLVDRTKVGQRRP